MGRGYVSPRRRPPRSARLRVLPLDEDVARRSPAAAPARIGAVARPLPPRRREHVGIGREAEVVALGIGTVSAATSRGTGGSERGGASGLSTATMCPNARANPPNTEYGLPAPVRSVSGGASISPSYSWKRSPRTFRTRRSPSRPTGSTQGRASTRSAFHSRASRGTRSTLLPLTTTRRDPSAARFRSSTRSESSRN
jgi:hypothetical protein